MKFMHISLTITEWVGSYGTRYFCHLFTDNGRTHDSREISVDEARTLQWELIRKGATKTAHYNPYGGHIYTREIRFLKID